MRKTIRALNIPKNPSQLSPNRRRSKSPHNTSRIIRAEQKIPNPPKLESPPKKDNLQECYSKLALFNQKIRNPHYYTPEAIQMRILCLIQTKESMTIAGKPSPERFRQIFMQKWNDFLSRKQPQHQCLAELAFKIVQVDMLEILLRRPFKKLRCYKEQEKKLNKQ